MLKLPRNLVGILSCLVLAGCAGTPLVVDVSDSIYRGATPTHSAAHRISAIAIINKADDGKMVNTTLGSDSVFPIKPETPTRVLVEQDIKRYLEEHLVADPSAKRSLFVTISKADAYWVWGSAAKLPFVGLALAGANTDIGMNLKVLIEIEDSGKVISSYQFDENIVIKDKATDQEAIAASYRKLIETYRMKFFGELDIRFINRYF